MPDVISSLANVMRTDIKMIDTIANNAANVNAIGHRGEFTVRSEKNFDSLLESMASSNSLTTVINTNNGQIEQTSQFTDLAISGDAWFSILTPQGERYTRAGNFAINAEGYLVNSQNFPVLSEQGEINIGAQTFTVNDKGVLTAADGSIFDLKLMQPQSLRQIFSEGEAIYGGKFLPIDNSGYRIMQGALEKSNVDISEDMVKLMETTRHIESMQRAMSTYDELLNTGINQLGNR